MTLIYDTGAAQPATHVFVIGVGHYPNLPAQWVEGRELPSATQSAIEFVEWVKTSYSNPSAPLGTISIALTPAPTQTNPWPGCDSATLNNIRQGFKDWFHRCNASPGNVAIFFFAGHGVWREEAFGLTAEFDPTDLINPWGGAFAIRQTWLGMGRCNAATQLFFVDACQSLPPDMANAPSITALGLITPTVKPSQRDAPLVHAASPGQAAYGTPGQAANFTQALLHVFKAGPDRHSGGWALKTGDLVKVREVLEHWADLSLIPDQNPTIEGGSGKTVLHFQNHPPEIETTVTPSTAVALELQEVNTKQSFVRAQDVTPWVVRVPKGIYRATASNGGKVVADRTEALFGLFGRVEL